MLERVLSNAWVGERDPLCDALGEHAKASLSRRFHRHYLGFARSQYKHVVEGDAPTAKRVLYVLRTALTGVHLLKTGACEPDLTRLYDIYDIPEVDALVLHKKQAEKQPLLEPHASVAVMDRALEMLDHAKASCELPEHPSEAVSSALEGWLVETRLARI